MVDKNDILLDLYPDAKNPNSYGSIHGLLQSTKNFLPSIKREDIANFLKTQKSYTLHRVTNNFFFLCRRVVADLSSLSRYNKGYKYILVFVDVFSRFTQCIPLKRKDANSVHNALNKILNSGHFNNLKRLNTDEGREFYNGKVKKLLTSKDITLYSVSSREIKAAIAKRFICTLKEKLFRYMTHQNTKKYIHILPKFIS